jgi:hypothetical protein
MTILGKESQGCGSSSSSHQTKASEAVRFAITGIQVTQTSIVRFSVSGLQADGSGEEAALLGGAEQSSCANRFTSCTIVALVSLCVYYPESGRLC